MSVASYFLAAVFVTTSVGTARGQQTPADAWQAAAAALRQRPGLVRFYSFKNADMAQSNLAGAAAAMAFKPDNRSALTTEAGRVAGLTAAVLDGESFEAPAVTLPTNAFTVMVWLRPVGMGSKTGNSGSVNGMIASSGSGYNDGWRLLVYDWKTKQPSVELGREKGSFSVRANDGLSAGFWNHLAATWDGARVRLYINGMLSAEQPYAGPALAPKAALRIGFSGYGVGSLKMAVDELAVLDRALPAEEIAVCSLPGAPLPETLKPLVARAQTAAAAGDPALAAAAYHAVALAQGLPTVWRSWAELAAARLAAGTNAVRACVALFENPAAPAHLRGQAVAFLAQASHKGAELPSRVLSKLPDFLELDNDEQRQIGLALGAAFAREKNFDAAANVLKRLLALSEESPPDAADLRQRYAQTLRQAGRFDAAREQYARVAADARLPAYAQGLAALALGQTWRQESKFAEAAAAYQAAANRTNQLAHLKSEAEACADECANLAAGMPARDPEASRHRLPPLPPPALAFFVAPAGSDKNPGTLKKPFATLERARDAVRARKTRGALPAGGATVYLRGGTYAVTNTFVLSELDSGSIGAPVVYRAWQDEKPVFDGGFHVRGFKKVRDPAVLARLPPEGRARVRVADLKAQGYTALDAQKSYGYGLNNKTVRELYQDGKPLQIARWPNSGTLKIDEVLDATNNVFACKADRLARWAGASELMANGYWVHLWAGCTVPVAAIDPAAGTLRLKEKPGYGMVKERPFYVLNLLEEIDQPGEWFLDRASGLLYVWPVKHPWFSDLVLTRWDKPFIAADKVQETVFRGLTFEYGQQHGLVLDECVNTTVAGCVVRRLGGTALTALRCANLKIYGNVLHTLGHTGLHVSGGNRKNLTPGRIVIENNDVGNFGRCSRTYNPALLLEGCGARVAHNRFHHAPSSAMRVEGNDHVIEFNQVDRVVRESDDQGGIDMWGNPSYRGVVIRYNRWQDIGGGEIPCGQAGIRFDDAISGMLVYGNLFERTSNGNFGGVQIHGGHKNIIDNNVFVGCRYGVSFSPWAHNRWIEYLNRANVQKLMFSEVNILLPPYSARYPELKELGAKANVNSLWRNVFVGSEQALYKAPKDTDAWGNQVFAELPNLDAVAAQSLFRPLPLGEIGLYDDPARAKE
jgi:hypothetical protein